MTKISKANEFQEKTTSILNEVAEIVLNWNLGRISNGEAMEKINKAFAKQNFLSS